MFQAAITRMVLLWAVVFTVTLAPAADAASLLDPTFAMSAKPSMRRHHSMAMRPDGRVVVGVTTFVTIDGQPAQILALEGLQKDGGADASFGNDAGLVNLSLGPVESSDRVDSVTVLRDGSILAVSVRAPFLGPVVSRVVRVSADGLAVTRWPDVPAAVRFTEKPDGGLYAWGRASGAPYIRRFTADGSAGDAFELGMLGVPAAGSTPGQRVSVSDLTLTSRGDLVVALAYSSYPVARVTPGGSIVWVMAGWPDGGRSVAGQVLVDSEDRVTVVPGTDGDPAPLIRLNANGTPDTNGFHSPAILMPGKALRQRDGRLIVSGGFYEVAGFTRRHVVRLMSDGSVDLDFDPYELPGIISTSGLGEQPDGRVVMLCDFVPPPVLGTGLIRLLPSNEDQDGRTTVFYAPDALEIPECGVYPKFTVTRAGDISGTNTLTVTAEAATATAGADFTPITTNIVFLPGQRFADVRFDIAPDGEPEGDELILMRLTSEEIPVTSENPFRVTIRDSVCSVGFLTNRIELGEGGLRVENGGFGIPFNANGIYRFHVRRRDITAFKDRDYWSSELDNVASISPIDNDRVDGDRIVRLEIEPISPGLTIVGEGTMEVVIKDDDTAAGPSRGFAGLNASNIDRVTPHLDRGWLINGGFTSVDGASRWGLARLTRDGLLDPSFNPPGRMLVACVAVQTDGKVLVGGNFDTGWSPVANGVIRLEADGRLDPTFFLASTNAGLAAIALDPDKRILVHWFQADFTRHIERLNADGSLQQTWRPPKDPYLTDPQLLSEPGGNALLSSSSGYYRLAADGSIQTIFEPQFSEPPYIGISGPAIISVPSPSGGPPDVWLATSEGIRIYDAENRLVRTLSQVGGGPSALLPIGTNRILVLTGTASTLFDETGTVIATHAIRRPEPSWAYGLRRPALASWGEIGVLATIGSDRSLRWLRLDGSGVPVNDIAIHRIALEPDGRPSVSLRGQAPYGYDIYYSDDLTSWNRLVERTDVNTDQSFVLPGDGANPDPARRFYQVRPR